MINHLLPTSRYARNVITLITGTGLAQAIPIAISPLLTRLYSPEDFGVFAIYMSVVSIASVVVTGRYELAIGLPKKNSDAMQLVILSIALSFIVSALLLVILLLFNVPITQLLGDQEIFQWLYLVPVSTLLAGVYQSLSYWSNRKGQYKRLAVSRTVQSGGGALMQLGGGYVAANTSGLVVGQLVGQVLSSGVLAWQIYRDDKILIYAIHKKRMSTLAIRYVNFPKYLILAHTINMVSSQIPVMLLGAMVNSATAGFFILTQRVVGVPMAVVAGALGDVFRQEASHAYIHSGNCKEIYNETLKRLLLVSLFPFLVFFFVAPELFSFVFGEKWRIAGEYAQIITPMFFLRFVTSPLSAMYLIAQKQRLDLLWQSVLFSLIVPVFYFGCRYSTVHFTLVLFSFCYSVMYLINGVISYRLAVGGLSKK